MSHTAIYELSPGIWFIPGANKGRFPFSHSLYLESPAGVLIDAGAGPILQEFTGRVGRILLTHYHHDHVSFCALFPGARFAIHSADAPGIQSQEGYLKLSGMHELPESILHELIRQRDFHPVAVSRRLEGGERLSCGPFTVRVLHLPGHTPGHCAFFIEEAGILFGADIDLTPFGPWYGNSTSDVELFRESMHKVGALRPKLFLSSHSPPLRWEKAAPRLATYAAVLDERDRRILELLRHRPMTLEELTGCKLIYGRHPDPAELYRLFERNMVRQHLDALVRRGMVCQDNGTGRYALPG